jgi:hypothetical protein
VLLKIRCLILVTLLAVYSQDAAATTVDGFETDAFLIEVANWNTQHAHQSTLAGSVIGDDRDVWTHAYVDGSDSHTQLDLTSGDDSVLVNSGGIETGSVYIVTFQYDGPGINAYSLNTNFESLGDNAIAVEVSDADLLYPARISVELITNAGEPGMTWGQLDIEVRHTGWLVFPLANFAKYYSGLDLTDVDSLSVSVTLRASSRLAIASISSITIPEPESLSLVLALYGWLATNACGSRSP